MKLIRLRATRLALIGAAAGLLGWLAADGQRQAKAQLMGFSGTSYSGRATVVNITDIHNGPNPILICDTGPLPSSGGSLQATVLETNIENGELTLDTARAITTGDGGAAESETSMNNFHLEIMATDGTVSTLNARYIASKAVASCRSNGKVDLSADVDIEGLVLNGQSITVNKQLNQIVYFPGGYLVINEQTSSVSGTTGDISVIAIHVVVNGCMNGVICRSHADVTCNVSPPPPPSECGKLTGGGWIIGTPTGAKGTFGLHAGIRFGQFWGHLNYIDHGTGMHVKSTAVTSYVNDPGDPDCRDITYNVTIDGVPGTAFVIACDKGEPGRHDVFDITLSNGYHAGGDLGGSRPGGGNIQIHKCPPGWLKK